MGDLIKLVSLFRDEIRTHPDFKFVEFSNSLSHAWCKFDHLNADGTFRWRLRANQDQHDLDLYRGPIGVVSNGIFVHPRYDQYQYPMLGRSAMPTPPTNWIKWGSFKDNQELIQHVIRTVRGCHWSWVDHEAPGRGDYCTRCPKQLECLIIDVTDFHKR